TPAYGASTPIGVLTACAPPAGTAAIGVLAPYAGVVPKSKCWFAGTPFGLTLPVSVAPLVVTPPGGPVAAAGGPAVSSKAPMSQSARPSKFASNGRATPRWSFAGQPELSASSTAGLLSGSACVCV